MNKSKLSILLITHYYPPEVGAPQARLSEMAKVWASSGISVSVITCFPNHPNGVIHPKYIGRKHMIEFKNGVKIHRCQTYATPNRGVIKKLIGHLVFMVNVVRQYKIIAKKADIILVSSPTFFSVISAYVLGKMYRKPFIFEVRDLWPAVFKDLAIIKNSLLLYILEKVEMFLYKKSIKIVTVTNSFTKNIIERGLPKKKVITITNGVDTKLFRPISKDKSLAKSLKLDDKFIILYLGAHGISHGLTSIINVAENLKHMKKIHFLFVGDGAKKENLQLMVTEKKIKNVSFVSSQPKELIPNYYSISDVVLVPLKNITLFDKFIPSKMFEIMAMGKPIIGSVRGEAAEILKKSKGALVCEPENVEQLTKNIIFIHDNLNIQASLGKKSLSFVGRSFDREKLAKKYEKLFKSIIID